MISNKKRREVAQKLREPKEPLLAYPDDELIRLRRETGCHYGQDFYEHLADLIDRPTCNNVSEFGHNTASSFDFVCSHCGSRLIGDGMYCSPLVDDRFSHYGINFCPNCGAEVVE